MFSMQFAMGLPAGASTQDAELAREVLEGAVLMAVQNSDNEAFERFFSLLRPLYDAPGLGAPARKNLVLGLNLMRLLAENRLAEFHSEVELVSEEMRAAAGALVAFPLDLEQYLMDGAYNKILAARNACPDALYQPLVDTLSYTVRTEIAACIEVSYESLAVKDAQKLLKFDDAGEMKDFIEAEKADWETKDGRIVFELAKAKKAEVESLKITKQCLEYANEMDRIV